MNPDYHIFKYIVSGYLALHFDKARRATFFNIAKVYLELNAVTKPPGDPQRIRAGDGRGVSATGVS